MPAWSTRGVGLRFCDPLGPSHFVGGLGWSLLALLSRGWLSFAATPVWEMFVNRLRQPSASGAQHLIETRSRNATRHKCCLQQL
jgi:hypothetical protein